MADLLHTDIRNPDSSLNVQFFSRLKRDNFQSEKNKLEGKEDVFRNVDYIRISIPGDILNAPERPVNPNDKIRFAPQWNAYRARCGETQAFVGTPLTKWSRLAEQQILELQAMRFSSVEAIAQASDAHINGIGMIAGQSAYSFRDEAKAFLAKQEADSKLSEADFKVKAMKDELAAKEADLVAKMTAMQEQMTAMAAMVNAQQAQVDDAPRRGRPPKNQEAA